MLWLAISSSVMTRLPPEVVMAAGSSAEEREGVSSRATCLQPLWRPLSLRDEILAPLKISSAPIVQINSFSSVREVSVRHSQLLRLGQKLGPVLLTGLWKFKHGLSAAVLK